MYKIIGNLLLLALFVSASAFTTTASAPTASQNQAELKAEKKSILSLNVSQTFSQTLTATWTATPGSGPYVVRLHLGAFVLQTVVTNGLTQSFKGLTIGQSYRISVQDLTGTVIISDLVPVTY